MSIRRPHFMGIFAALSLFGSGCGSQSVEVGSVEAFRALHADTAGVASSDFLGICYLGTTDVYDHFVFEHTIGDDVFVVIPVGCIQLSGRRKFSGNSDRVPLAAVMDKAAYITLLESKDSPISPDRREQPNR